MHHADDGARSLTLTNSSHIEYRESPGGLTDFLSRGASGGGGGGRERPEKTNQVSTNAVPSAAGDLRVWPSSSNQSSGIPPRPLLAVGLNPKRIIKGSFLQEAPHITLPPLNHICSAISSSSTCSNFCSWKKNLSLLFFCLFCSFLLLHFHPELTSLSHSPLHCWSSSDWSSACCCVFYEGEQTPDRWYLWSAEKYKCRK